MAHIETKDPFGFVGSHVVRRQPKKGGEEHGWLTRYDEALDCYTLFVPGGGEPRLLARGEVMKFLSAPNIELHDDDQDEFPPPVRDTTTSRYLGVKLRQPREGSNDDDSNMNEDVRGQVTCFLPFGDCYCVEYEDGSTEEVSESAVIDGMVALIKSPFFSSPSRKHARNSTVRTRRSKGYTDEDETGPGRRKRPRVEADSVAAAHQIPPGSVAVVENVADEQMDDEVVIVDHAEVDHDAVQETEPAPNILEIMSSTLGSATRENALEMASESELLHIDGDEVADQDGALEIDETCEEPGSNDAAGDAAPNDAALEEKRNSAPFYIIDKKPHEATEPLPRRAMAFELLRASLLNLLDRQEASSVKIAMQYDLLGNPDVRDRDAIIRFMEAEGLMVLNHLLNSFATEVLDDEDEESKEDGAGDSPEKIRERMEHDDELLHVLKTVAMLPTPARNQVIDSNIGKTINYLSKSRGPPGRKSALPKCITALAKWIKTAWIKNIPPASKTSPKAPAKTRQSNNRPQQQPRRGGRGGSPGRRSLQLNRRQPPSQRPQRQVSSAPRMPPEENRVPEDNTPIPRLSRPRQAPPPFQPPAPTQSPAPRRVTGGGLKPAWMRQKENLSRSRFCINDNTNVDTRLYQNSRSRPITNAPVVAPASQVPPPHDQNLEQDEDAGGPDGVFGRSQRLRFGKRWKRQEFEKYDPPGVLTQPRGSYSMPSYGRSQEPYGSVNVPPVTSSRRGPARPILRRVSRYNDQPVIEGTGR